MPVIALLASYLLVSYYSVAEGKYISEFVDNVYYSEEITLVERSADDAATAESVAVSQKYSDCLKTFGDKTYCRCLRDKTPAEIDFRDYVKVLTTSKSELGYAEADHATQQIIDNTLKTAEVCIAIAEQ